VDSTAFDVLSRDPLDLRFMSSNTVAHSRIDFQMATVD
jgi:hypothetical protein